MTISFFLTPAKPLNLESGPVQSIQSSDIPWTGESFWTWDLTQRIAKWNCHGHILRFLAGLSFPSSPARLGRFSKTYPHALHDTLTQTALLPVRVTMWCGHWSSSSSPPLCASEVAAAMGLESELELELESSIGLALSKRSARGFIIPGITSNILTTNRRQRLSGSTHRNGEFSMIFCLDSNTFILWLYWNWKYRDVYLMYQSQSLVSILSCHYCHCWWLDTGLLIQCFFFGEKDIRSGLAAQNDFVFFVKKKLEAAWPLKTTSGFTAQSGLASASTCFFQSFELRGRMKTRELNSSTPKPRLFYSVSLSFYDCRESWPLTICQCWLNKSQPFAETSLLYCCTVPIYYLSICSLSRSFRKVEDALDSKQKNTRLNDSMA